MKNMKVIAQNRIHQILNNGRDENEERNTNGIGIGASRLVEVGLRSDLKVDEKVKPPIN